MITKQNMAACITCAFAVLCSFSAKETYGKTGSDNKVKIYQLTWNGDNVAGSLYVNDILITSFTGAQAAGGAPLNVWLIGDNEIRAELKKAKKSEASHFTFGVSEMFSGDISDTSDRGNLISVEKKDRDFAGLKVNKFSKKFKSSLNFSSRFVGTGTVTEKEVIEYAKKVYNIIKNKDSAGIAKEFSVKIEDYTKSFSNENAYDKVKESLVENLLSSGKLVNINPGRLKAKKTGPKSSTWHVVEGDKEFIRYKSSDGSSELPIYIGVVNGALKVIR